MTRVQPRPDRVIAPALAAILATAQDREAFDALRNSTFQCEWCFRRKSLSPHHVAQGFRDETRYLVQLIALLCNDCHKYGLHELPAVHARAIGISLIYHAGRGNNLELLWAVTGNKSPTAELCELWIKRIVQTREPTWRESWSQ